MSLGLAGPIWAAPAPAECVIAKRLRMELAWCGDPAKRGPGQPSQVRRHCRSVLTSGLVPG